MELGPSEVRKTHSVHHRNWFGDAIRVRKRQGGTCPNVVGGLAERDQRAWRRVSVPPLVGAEQSGSYAANCLRYTQADGENL